MIRKMFYYSFIILIVSCSKDAEVKTTTSELNKNKITIKVKLLKDKTNRAKAIEQLYLSNPDTLYFDSTKSNVYLGYYDEVVKAHRTGFDLVRNHYAEDFVILKGDALIKNPYRKFTVVGKYLENRYALYDVDIVDREVKKIWSRWGKKILSLEFSEDNSAAYFLTAFQYGMEGSFPYLTEAKLYYYKPLEEYVEKISQFGKGVSYYSFWDNDQYKSLFTSLDSVNTSILFQIKNEYGKEGNLIKSDTTKFDLEKEGFPAINKPELELNSHNNKYQLLIDSKSKLIKLLGEGEEALDTISIKGQTLEKVFWKNDSFAFFQFKNNNKELPKTIFIIYNLKLKSVSNRLELDGYRSFRLLDDFFIYDEGYDRESKIIFYDYKKNEKYFTLKVIGGCGIKTIPINN